MAIMMEHSYGHQDIVLAMIREDTVMGVAMM